MTSSHVIEIYKRYLLFGSDWYYPAGGLHDVIGSYDSIQEAKEVASKGRYDSYQLLDLDERKWVEL